MGNRSGQACAQLTGGTHVVCVWTLYSRTGNPILCSWLKRYGHLARFKPEAPKQARPQTGNHEATSCRSFAPQLYALPCSLPDIIGGRTGTYAARSVPLNRYITCRTFSLSRYKYNANDVGNACLSHHSHYKDTRQDGEGENRGNLHLHAVSEPWPK